MCDEGKKTNENVDEGTNVGGTFKKITDRLRARAERKGFRHDVTYAQGKVLFFLHGKENGEASMKEIEGYLDVSHATVSGLISRLSDKGYVVCGKSKEDARAKTVRLTEKENASFAEMKKRRRSLEETLLKGFSEEEREKLSEYLKRVYRNVREADEEDERLKKPENAGN